LQGVQRLQQQQQQQYLFRQIRYKIANTKKKQFEGRLPEEQKLINVGHPF